MQIHLKLLVIFPRQQQFTNYTDRLLSFKVQSTQQKIKIKTIL